MNNTNKKREFKILLIFHKNGALYLWEIDEYEILVGNLLLISISHISESKLEYWSVQKLIITRAWD